MAQLVLPPAHLFKKLGISLGVLVLLAFAFALIAPVLLNPEAAQKALVSQFNKAGYALEMDASISAATFPSPRLILKHVQIRKTGDADALVSAPSATMLLGWGALFGGASSPHVVFETPQFSLQAQQAISPLPLHASWKDGSIQLNLGTKTIELTQASGALTPESIAFNAALEGTPLKFSWKETNQALGLNIEMQGLALEVSGGKYTLRYTKDAAALAEFKGDALYTNGTLWLSRGEGAVLSKPAALSVYASLNNVPTLAVELSGEGLVLDPATQALTALLQAPSSTLDESYSLTLLADVRASTLGALAIDRLQTHAEYGGVDATIHNVNARIGNADVEFEGRYTSRTLGARIEGVAQAKGDSFHALLVSLDPMFAALPSDDLKAYTAKGHVFFSKDQFRVSEANVDIGDIGFTGGFATYLGANTRTEADLRFANANLDYVRDVWRKKPAVEASKMFEPVALNSGGFGWLKHVAGQVELKFNLGGFTFLDEKGTQGSFTLLVKPYELTLGSIQLQYPDAVLTGLLGVNVAGERPKFTLTMSAPRFNSSYLEKAGAEQKQWVSMKDGKPAWSEDLFDFNWVSGIDAQYDISIANAVWRGLPLGFLKAKGTVAQQSLNVQSFACDALGGQMTGTATISGGKVPALSGTVQLYNTHLEKLLAPLHTAESITGRANMSGTFSTSGLHMLEWIKQANAGFSVVARGVQVRGLNVKGVVDTTLAARTTADVVSGVGQLLRSGYTSFGVDGTFNLQQAVIRSPKLALMADDAQTAGVLSGAIELIPWTLNVDTRFAFPQLGGQVTPTLGLNLAGPIGNTTLRTDTSALEAFAAKRIVGQ